MKKINLAFILSLFPVLAFAADGSALSFAPPPSDMSVVFLGDIFGIVDGVLHGTGSQIMGTMFGVFNAAVLALGGIIIMYTLMVSTMNTAQEGQFLGQKWSSLWVPVRTTFGLALLIPKASGYCLMQIFVMWIVLQGVGAADKIWNAALNYLNQGGAIIMAPANPGASLISGGAATPIEVGAQAILAGQVCMLGLEAQLEQQRNLYLQQKQQKMGPCYGDVSSQMKTICSQATPSLLNTVNAVSVRERDTTNSQSSYAVDMPNFDSSSPYSFLNGICGTIKWKRLQISSAVYNEGIVQRSESISSINQGIDSSALSKSRSIAIQQMYSDLAPVAQIMVNNNPLLQSQSAGDQDQDNYSSIAKQQFGIPLTTSGTPCTALGSCQRWGAAPGSETAPLFTGMEFTGAVLDYNGVMRPVLTLEAEAKNAEAAKQSRAFIQDAENSGWIMAGAYFFNLVALNQSAMSAGSAAQDTDTGLDSSTFSMDNLSSVFSTSPQQKCNDQSPYSLVCYWLNQDSSQISPIEELIKGGGDIPTVNAPTFKGQMTVVSNAASSSVYGFTNNSPFLAQANQPGQGGLNFANKMAIKINPSNYKLPGADFPCGGIKILFIHICIGEMIGNIIYNGIFVPIYNIFFSWINNMIQQAVFVFLEAPLAGMAAIFKEAVTFLSKPGVNPIVALAQMGTYYINFAAELWLMIIDLSIGIILIPILGMVIFVMITLAMPLILAWTGTMVGIGFITAYYVPLLPYLIFTFATIAWFIAVIEAMVAAPIVALGVTHPEGHEAFGKGESAIMILMNVFLRPSMMIIGYIASIALSYVGVWLLNAGFEHAVGFIQNPSNDNNTSMVVKTSAGDVSGGYTGWAGIFAYFFSILMYVTTYLVIVQRSFTLITYLPDKVLRWIGGAPESVGGEAAQWGEEAKSQVKEAGSESGKGSAGIEKQLKGYAGKGISSAKKAFGEKMQQRGATATGRPSTGGGGGGGGGGGAGGAGGGE